MKTWKKILIALIILGAVGAWAGYEFVYNKPHTDYEKAEADFNLKAESLFNAFRENPQSTGEKYGGKVIQITGLMSSVEESDSLVIGVFAFDQGMFGDEGVRVTMLPNHGEPLKEYNLSNQITLKGFCAGYNDTDVIIESGSIVK